MKKIIFALLGIVLLCSCVERSSSEIEADLTEQIQNHTHVVTLTFENDNNEIETHEYLVYGGYSGWETLPIGHCEGCSYCKNKRK